jgi:NADH dehydrogenase
MIDGSGVTINGERIEAANVFWCAGTRAEPVAEWLGASAARNGGVEVTSECSIPGYPEIFSVGDVASFKGEDGTPLPGLAPVAKQQGEYVAKVIASRIGAGKHPGPFVYKNLGTMAVIGRSHAVAVLGKIKLTGSLAWLAWSLVHLFLLIGFRNRIIVFVNWAWAYVTYGRGSRLVEGRVRQELEDDHLAGLEKCRPASPPEHA